jgi:oxygen-independent coproporphyrinogen-3 oxidase
MKKHMGLIRTEDIPAAEEKLNILKMTGEKLTDAGYVFIGMDHFAKPNDELTIALREKKLYRNFQGYSTNAGADLYAMGITGISQLEHIYTQNYKTEKEYYKALDDEILPVAKGYRLSDDDVIRRHVIMKIMCDFELDIKSIEQKFNINFNTYFAWGLNNLKEMETDDLVKVTDNKIIVNGMGRLLIRNIAINFDGYIERQEDTAKYSRTV